MDWGAVRRRLVAAGWTSASVDSARHLDRDTPLRDPLERAVAPLALRSAAEGLVATVALDDPERVLREGGYAAYAEALP